MMECLYVTANAAYRYEFGDRNALTSSYFTTAPDIRSSPGANAARGRAATWASSSAGRPGKMSRSALITIPASPKSSIGTWWRRASLWTSKPPRGFLAEPHNGKPRVCGGLLFLRIRRIANLHAHNSTLSAVFKRFVHPDTRKRSIPHMTAGRRQARRIFASRMDTLQ